jgi:hypothetical protein
MSWDISDNTMNLGDLDDQGFIPGRMSRREYAMWIEAEGELVTHGRSAFYGVLLQSQRDVETAISTARVWDSVYTRLFQ